MDSSSFSAFMPHGMCYMWRWDILILHVGSDLLIAAAYFSIPAALFVLIRKRPDIPRGIIKLFVAFILLCGITHVVSIFVIWQPIYIVQGMLKLATAVVSVMTAIVLWPLIPKIIAMPSVTDLELRNSEIAALNKRLESRLESLSTLAGGVSHEFNNLLTVIAGNAELLEQSMLDPDDRRKLTAIQRAAHNSADICAKMLAYSGSGHFVMEEIDLGAFLNKLKITEYRKHAVSLEIETKLSNIQGSPGQLKQLLETLITNSEEAIDEAGHEDGKIHVAVYHKHLDTQDLQRTEFEHHCEAGDYVILEVNDNGTGLSPETREHMFEPYFTTKFTGRGLGLAAVQGIVRGHNACLFVDSEVSRSSTISIAFPLLSTKKTSYNPPRCREPELVLIVDDEEQVLRVARTYLEELGIQVLTAENSTEALALALQYGQQIDALILDYLMPDETGLELLEKLAKIIEVDTYLTSGFTRGEISDPALHALLTGFIAKPFNRKDFEQIFGKQNQGR
jgi:signal transduction histidine kinase